MIPFLRATHKMKGNQKGLKMLKEKFVAADKTAEKAFAQECARKTLEPGAAHRSFSSHA